VARPAARRRSSSGRYRSAKAASRPSDRVECSLDHELREEDLPDRAFWKKQRDRLEHYLLDALSQRDVAEVLDGFLAEERQDMVAYLGVVILHLLLDAAVLQLER